MHSQATLQCTPRAPVCINTCKVQLTRLAPACTGICNLQCTWGRGGKCFSPQGPETLAARDALRLGYRWRGVADRLSLRSRRPRAGRGLTRGFSRAGAWGPGRGGGGCAWLGWSCSPFNRRRRASPPPPPPPPLLRRLLAPGPARASSRARPAQAPRPISAVTRPRARCGHRPERPEEAGSAAAAAAAAALGDRGGCGAGLQSPGLRPPPANRRRRAARAVLWAGEWGAGGWGAAWRGGGGRSPRPARRPPAPRCSAAPFLHPPLRGAGASALRAAAASCPAPRQAPALGMANLRPVAASASAGPRSCF